MEEEVEQKNNIKTWIIVGIVSIITFILVFTITYKLMNNGKESTEPVKEDTEQISFDAYKVGDKVTLLDNSKWHVLYASIKNTENVTLLSDEDVNAKKVLYSDVDNYLTTDYQQKLLTSLKAEKKDIVEIRKFAYLDLANLAGMQQVDFSPEPETEIANFSIPSFVYEKETVTDTVYHTEETTEPVMICTKDLEKEKEARFCLGNSKEVLPVRAVIIISKKYIKNDNTSSNNRKGDE